MDELIRVYIDTIHYAVKRMRQYRDTGETKYLVDSEMYLRMANIYMQDIFSKDANERVKYENC